MFPSFLSLSFGTRKKNDNILLTIKLFYVKRNLKYEKNGFYIGLDIGDRD